MVWTNEGGANNIKDKEIYVTNEGGKVGGHAWEHGVPGAAMHGAGHIRGGVWAHSHTPTNLDKSELQTKVSQVAG